MKKDAADNTDPLARAVLDSLSAHIAILDKDGMILEVNQAWKQYAQYGGLRSDNDAVGLNYLRICDATRGADEDDARVVAEGIRSVIDGRKKEFLHDYPCHAPDGKHWYYMRVVRMAGAGPLRVVVSHEDITALKHTEEALQASQRKLRDQKSSLEETNIALKVLLQRRDADREDMERRILSNVRDLVMPYLEKLKGASLRKQERTLLEITESHLREIVSPFLQRFAVSDIVLTPQEIQVATLVRDGRSSKEIAEILYISETTVHFHRRNLRDKLGLKNRKQNLRAYLLSMAGPKTGNDQP